jgi:hypothetical protein
MLSFLTPLFLFGMLAAAIPLIIHLSRSKRTKKMRFSTTRFFNDQFLRSYRMSRLKELLLLSCRMALFGFFALALARPLFLPQGAAFMPGKERTVVLVLDNSASMGLNDGSGPLLGRAKASARELVDGLSPGDKVSVVLAGRHDEGPEVLFPQPTSALGDVLQSINGLQVATLGTDLTGAVAKAEAIALDSPSPSKEVYVLSDMQYRGWEQEKYQTQPRDGSEVLFFFVKVRPKEVENIGITAINYAAARPMVGVPFAIRPILTIQNDKVRSVDVRLYVEDRNAKSEGTRQFVKVSEKQVDKLPNGRWASPRFYHAFDSGGWHSGYVEVNDPALPQDNRRYFAFNVLSNINVLAVNGAPSQVERLDELFFLRLALTAAPEGKEAPIRLDTVAPVGLAGKDLSKYPLVILANVESLSAEAVEKLESFVDRGGNLLVFLGDHVNPAFYNSDLAALTRLHGGLLPGRVMAVEGNAASDKDFAEIQVGASYDHIALAAFNDPKFAGLLSGVKFKALYKIDPGKADVLMRATTLSGDSTFPLLTEKAFGQGHVLMFASTCDRDWTNFPVRPAFLPWTHRLVAHLAQEPMGRQGFYETGREVVLPVAATDAQAKLLVKKPDGKPATLVEDATASGRRFRFTDTAQAGIYSLVNPDKPDAVQLFAVNLEGYESDLTYLDEVLQNRSGATSIEAGLKEMLPQRPLITYVDDPAKLGEASSAARRGFKLWDFLLAIVLAIALFEPWLANRISIRHYSRARDVSLEQAIRGDTTTVIKKARPAPEPAVQEVGRQ